MIINKILVSDTEPRNERSLWAKPLSAGGFGWYAFINGRWQSSTPMANNGTYSPYDDTDKIANLDIDIENINKKLDKCATLDNNNPYELDIWSSYTASNGPSYQPDILYIDGHQVAINSGINNYEAILNAHGLELKDPTGTVTISADSWRNKYSVDPKIKISDGEVCVHDNIGIGISITETEIQLITVENTATYDGTIWMKGNRLVMSDAYHDNFDIGSPIVVEDDLGSYYTKTEIDTKIGDINSILDTINGEEI